MEGSFVLTLSTVRRKQWDRTGQGTYLGPPHPQPKDTAVIKTLETREHLLSSTRTTRFGYREASHASPSVAPSIPVPPG